MFATIQLPSSFPPPIESDIKYNTSKNIKKNLRKDLK